MDKILSGDEPCVELDGYRLPDGDPVLVIGKEYFRFANGSQPFEQTEIYKQAAKLVDLIAEYKKKMTKEEKRKLYEPKWWALYENGQFVSSYPSHAEAKRAKHIKVKEADADWLDLYYEIKPYNR